MKKLVYILLFLIFTGCSIFKNAPKKERYAIFQTKAINPRTEGNEYVFDYFVFVTPNIKLVTIFWKWKPKGNYDWRDAGYTSFLPIDKSKTKNAIRNIGVGDQIRVNKKIPLVGIIRASNAEPNKPGYGHSVSYKDTVYMKNLFKGIDLKDEN